VEQEVPKVPTYEETLHALEDSFGDQHLAAAYRSKLKTRTRVIRESLQAFVTAVEQLDHCVYPALSQNHIKREADKAFADGEEDLTTKIQLLLRGEKWRMRFLVRTWNCRPCSLKPNQRNECLDILWKPIVPKTDLGHQRRWACWSCEEPGHFWGK
jgi:hypothetical protein